MAASYGVSAFYYEIAANMVCHEAELVIGYFYEHGFGVVPSYDKAIYYYQKAAATGSYEALLLLGRCCQLGLGISKSDSKAQQIYAMALERCTEDIAKSNFEFGTALLQKALKQRDGTPIDVFNQAYWTEKSFRYLQLAFLYYVAKAALGDLNAAYKVVECYRKGLGVKRDESQAANYIVWITNRNLQKAKIAQLENDAKQGDRDATYQLDLCFLYGNCMPPSKEKYKQKLILAAAQGHKLAFADFLSKYGYGMDGFFLSYEEMKSAAETGDTSAKTMLGYFFEQGLGFQKSYTQAIHWYEKAAKENDYLAMWHLANCYEFGQGAEKSTKKPMNINPKGIQRYWKQTHIQMPKAIMILRSEESI